MRRRCLYPLFIALQDPVKDVRHREIKPDNGTHRHVQPKDLVPWIENQGILWRTFPREGNFEKQVHVEDRKYHKGEVFEADHAARRHDDHNGETIELPEGEKSSRFKRIGVGWFFMALNSFIW